MLSLLFSGEFVYGQIPRKPQFTPREVPIARLAQETYNACDLEVLKTDLRSGKCNEAFPPLNSGACLSSQQYCVNPQYVTARLIAYPGRPGIVDKNNATVVVLGEAFTISAFIIAKDKATLQQVLDSAKVQFQTGNRWVTRATLQGTDYGPLSNIRTYQFSDCGKDWATFSRNFEKAEKLYYHAHAGLSRNPRPNVPRPAPESDLNGIPSAPPSPTGGLLPVPAGDEQHFWDEVNDAATKRAAKDLDAFAASKGAGSCEPKTLPYYWTSVSVEVSPELNDTQIRLHVDSTLAGKGTVTLPDRFKVYTAASALFDMPAIDGNREFSFTIYSSGDMSITTNGATPTVLYGESARPMIRRTGVDVAQIGETTINGRPAAVKAWRAKGQMPFRKDYFDEDTRSDVSETAVHAGPGEAHPRAIKAGRSVAYRMEISFAEGSRSFVSRSANFTMPNPLTLALMGDSFSAGEGAPDLAAPTPWMNELIGGENCHRSRNSGLFRAVNLFIKESNKPIDYVFVACSGAVIQDMISQPQPSERDEDDHVTRKIGVLGPVPLAQPKSQIDLVLEWRDSKGYVRVNGALFGIGGNNAGFADVITAALFGGVPAAVADRADAGLEFVEGPSGHKAVASALKVHLGVQKVIILGYPDVVHAANGSVCPTDCSPLGSINTVTPSALNYGAQFLTRLNDAVKSAANLPGWEYADIFAATQNHGMCVCDDMFFNTWTAATGLSLLGPVVQIWTPLRLPCSAGNAAIKVPRGASCSYHPSERGYREYVCPILTQLRAVFGTSGVLLPCPQC